MSVTHVLEIVVSANDSTLQFPHAKCNDGCLNDIISTDWWNPGLGNCADGRYPEEFWNCADIAITDIDGGFPSDPQTSAPTSPPATTDTPTTIPPTAATPAPTPNPAGSASVRIDVTSPSWGTGCTMNVVMTFPEAVSSWVLQLTFDPAPTAVENWGSSQTSYVDGVLTLASMSWNGNTAAGTSRTIGMVVRGDSAPSPCYPVVMATLNGMNALVGVTTTAAPQTYTVAPSASPTENPTHSPSTQQPTAPPTTSNPSTAPSATPSATPSESPTEGPTAVPTTIPTAVPTQVPTSVPTLAPTQLTCGAGTMQQGSQCVTPIVCGPVSALEFQMYGRDGRIVYKPLYFLSIGRNHVALRVSHIMTCNTWCVTGNQK